MTENAELPDGQALDEAITAAKDGRLGPEQFAAALTAATLMMAVVPRPEDDGASPFVIAVEGVDYGVAFTSPGHHDEFAAQAPFVLMSGAALGEVWPAGLGLALNPGDESGILLAPPHLDQLVRGVDPDADRPAEVVPAGTPIRIGAPDPGLPEPALDLLRRLVQADPDVAVAYQLAVAIGDEPVQLAVGVEAAGGSEPPAERFAATVRELDSGFNGLPFFDLDGRLLAAAREYSAPLS